MSSPQLDPEDEVEYTRFIGECTYLDTIPVSPAPVPETTGSESTHAEILTPESSTHPLSDDADVNWSINEEQGNSSFDDPQSRQCSLATSGACDATLSLPVDCQFVPYNIAQHDWPASSGMAWPTGGLKVDHNQYHEHNGSISSSPSIRGHDAVIAQVQFSRSATPNHPPHSEWTTVKGEAQDTGTLPQASHVDQYSMYGVPSCYHALRFGGTDFHNFDNYDASRVDIAEDPYPPQGVTHLGLPIRDINESPWSHLSASPAMPSRLATAPIRMRQLQAEQPSQRVSSAGAIVRPQHRPLRPSEASIRRASVLASSVTSPTPAPSPSVMTLARQRHGGRQGSLTQTQARGARLMREEKSCWQCALQRVKCNEGSVCTGCAERIARRPTHTLGCVRTVLTEMINTFIPMRMTQVHSPAVVELTVEGSMTGWVSVDGYQGLEVNLTVGYGPVVPMSLHEFIPRTHEVVCQLQWVKDASGEVRCTRKNSPPLAIKNFRGQDNETFDQLVAKFRRHIDRLVETHLKEFEAVYCDDQDDDPFRKSLISLLCTLYKEAPLDRVGVTLRADLKAALRSIIATDIMLHNLTFEKESQNRVISDIRDSMYNDPGSYTEYTSPKLVNRQFKALISGLQEEFCQDVLRRLHKIFRTFKGARKEHTWLSSFVLLLAMAMCQEELEHNRYLRADGEVQRGEQAEGPAFTQARADCRSADQGFDFLLTLFHYKYSRPKLHAADLKDWWKVYNNDAERRFLRNLVRSALPYQAILLQRKSQEVTSTTKLYKSRLVGKFLAGFMGLDQDITQWRELVA